MANILRVKKSEGMPFPYLEGYYIFFNESKPLFKEKNKQIMFTDIFLTDKDDVLIDDTFIFADKEDDYEEMYR
ncbi:MAG: hypothetical protein QXV17_08205 [Candidatus Micrarchaeaceae archaeon]